MSAMAIPVHVIKMLDASILKVLSAVLVNRDTLEMAQYVKVRTLSVHSQPQDSNFGGKTKLPESDSFLLICKDGKSWVYSNCL